MLNRWPSPEGSGDQAPFLKNFFAEKLLNETPKVPTKLFPNHQTIQFDHWSLSSTTYSISTVPSFGLGIGLTPNFSGSK